MNISRKIGPVVAFLIACGPLVFAMNIVFARQNPDMMISFTLFFAMMAMVAILRVIILDGAFTFFTIISGIITGVIVIISYIIFGMYASIISGAIVTGIVLLAMNFKYISSKSGYFPAYIVGIFAVIMWISGSCTNPPKDVLWYNITADCSSDGSLCTDSGLAGVRNTGITFIPLGIQVPEDRFIVVPSLRKEVGVQILDNQKIPYGYECADSNGCPDRTITRKEKEIFIVRPYRYSTYRTMHEVLSKVPEPLVVHNEPLKGEHDSALEIFIKYTHLDMEEVS